VPVCYYVDTGEPTSQSLCTTAGGVQCIGKLHWCLQLGGMRTVSPLLRTAWQPRCQGPRAVCSAAADVQPRRVPHTNELLTPYEMAGVQLQHRVV